ncbi:MAG: TatD family hydrolase [bacterium]
MIDTHCHINIMVQKKPDQRMTEEMLAQCDAIVVRAHAAGVQQLITVGTSVAESRNCILLAQRYSTVSATIGVHPCDSVTQDGPLAVGQIVSELEQLLSTAEPHIVAIGEIGLDYYHQPYDAAHQKEVFIAQLELALRWNKPVVIHIRDAGVDALAVLRHYKDRLRGVVHCFSLDLAAAEELISWGWMIGIDGPVTYPKNSALREIVARVSLDGVLLETDAPFLPPQSLRGKSNCPSNLGIIADEIARVRGVSREEIIAATTANAQKLFNLL